jgi:hypothetical protein
MASMTMLASPSVDETVASQAHLEGLNEAASIGGNHSQWRPETPASDPSPTTRSNSPLLHQWVRKQQALLYVEQAQRQSEHDQTHHVRSQTAQPDLENRRNSGALKLTVATRSGSVRLHRPSRGEDRRTGTAGASAATLTRDEFEHLPPAVQRKVSCWLVPFCHGLLFHSL